MRPLLPPPPPSSPDYSLPLSNLASRILYPNPLPSSSTQHALYILNSAAFPDARETSYDDLVPYLLARLPAEDDLLAGHQYEILFFAKASADDAGKPSKKRRPGWQWCVQTYQLLSRILRKRLSRLWIVGAESWVRMLVEGVMVISGGKGRKKVVFLRSVRDLEGWGVRVSELCVPCGVWVTEKRRRKKRRGSAGEEEGANGRGKRAFGVREPLPRCTGEELEEGRVRLPRVLREATSFLLMDECVKMEGIFRVNAKAVMVEVLQELYDQGQQFIVWRERDSILCFPFWRDGTGDVGMDELKEKDGYDVHSAAGLIKLWYKELREPIFPQSCYEALGKFYGDADLQLEPHQLVEMLRPDAEWTILTTTARRILRMHLLPLLSRVVDMEKWNHMAAYGLAVCFTPALLRGPDIEEDMKMMGIARRLLDAMVRHWKEHLAPVFEADHQSFETELRLPEVVADREDPLEEGGDSIPPSEAQMSGITLIDNDGSASDTAQEDGSEEEDEAPPLPQRPAPLPPLPPRPRTFVDSEAGRPSLPPRVRSSTIAAIPCTSDPTSSPTTNGVDPSVKRKPAPTVQPLPRYSMVVGTSSSLHHQQQQQAQPPLATLEHIPFYNSVEQPVEEPLDLDPDAELPVYEAMPESSSSSVSPSANRAAIPRKPVPVKSEKGG